MAASRFDAASYYRLAAPLSLLAYQGLEVEIGIPSASKVDDFDVLWMQMHADPEAELLARIFKDKGKALIYDVDDWLFSMPPSWPGYDHYFVRGTGQPTARLGHHERLIGLADVITTTTGYLAQKLRTRFPGKEIAVLPNCILAGDWDTLDKIGHSLDGPVLGWFGSGTHWDDWAEIAPIVDRVLDQVEGYLALMGAPELVTCFPPRLRARTMIHPLVTMDRFSETRLLISSCDVGLCWVTDRLESNRCRSPLKALQWGAAGVPVVASATVYGDLQGASIRLANLTREDRLEDVLVETLSQVGSVALSEEARNWQERVFRVHSYEANAHLWHELLARQVE